MKILFHSLSLGESRGREKPAKFIVSAGPITGGRIRIHCSSLSFSCGNWHRAAGSLVSGLCVL